MNQPQPKVTIDAPLCHADWKNLETLAYDYGFGADKKGVAALIEAIATGQLVPIPRSTFKVRSRYKQNDNTMITATQANSAITLALPLNWPPPKWGVESRNY